MNTEAGRRKLIALVDIGAAVLLIVSFSLPWFQGRAEAVGSATWLSLLGKTGWLGALEVDLITFGAIVALLASIGGVLDLRRELALGVGVAAVVGFGAAVLGVLWTLAESGNSAFYWGVWGTNIDQGLGLWLFALAAVVGAVAAAIRVALPAPRPAPVPEPAPALYLAEAAAAAVRPAGIDSQPTLVNGAAPAAGGRVTYVEGGHSTSIDVGEGERVIVGRDLGADIRVVDAKVSRRHAMIEWSAGGWIVKDLGATNPTRLLDPSGSTQIVAGQIRIPSGQLVIGDVLVTLYPAGN